MACVALAAEVPCYPSIMRLLSRVDRLVRCVSGVTSNSRKTKPSAESAADRPPAESNFSITPGNGVTGRSRRRTDGAARPPDPFARGHPAAPPPAYAGSAAAAFLAAVSSAFWRISDARRGI